MAMGGGTFRGIKGYGEILGGVNRIFFFFFILFHLFIQFNLIRYLFNSIFNSLLSLYS